MQALSVVVLLFQRSYDLFLSQLLDGPVTKHKVLQSHLNQLTDVQSASIDAIKDEAECLAELEQQVMQAVKENKRYQRHQMRFTSLCIATEVTAFRLSC